MTTLVELAALSLLPIRWWGDAARAVRAGEQPRDLLERIHAEHRQHGPGSQSRHEIRSLDALRSQAAAALARASQHGIDAIGFDAAEYPPALAAIFDPPPVLWVRGCRDVLNAPAVAIVGSRAGSAYALAVAERLAGDLAARGFAVVSGLARGVDSAAHRGALTAGRTIAVLGSGVDVVYPPEHAALARTVADSGALVSELLPGTPPRREFFPRRNRVISGLARAVVIVEAGEKSGSLITARMALEQGRDVLAVPGNVLSDRNRGGHALLRDGAKIVESADDIVEEVNQAPHGERAQKPSPADPVLASLPIGDGCDLDAIAERSGLTTSRLLPRLFELELQGLVRRVGGGRFMRVDRTC